MILDILEIAITFYASLYLIISVVIAVGGRLLKSYELPPELPDVSVIVCARNEEEDIRRCLESMLNIDYPREKLDILLVDDESEDVTMDIMNEYAARDGMFRVLSAESESHDLPGKQRPLNLGIRESSGEIVLVTDADIAVRPDWIKGHVSSYRENIGIVGGITRVSTDSGSIFSRVQNVDQISKLAVAMGCAGLGFPLTIMGNNISFRREAFGHIGGFSGMRQSVVEDMALMNAIVRQTDYTLGWVPEKSGVVESSPEKDFNTFINQHFRWIFEVSDLSNIGKFMLSVEMMMFTVFIVSLFIAPWNMLPLAATVIAWIIGYYIMLFPSPARGKGDILYIPASLVFQMIYAIALGWRLLFGSKTMVWKGREYEKKS